MKTSDETTNEEAVPLEDPYDIVDAFKALRKAANGCFDWDGPPCDNCELPVDISDPDHKLPCGCLLCQICLDRGRDKAHADVCKKRDQ
jgi:hypothetical protein